MSKSETYMLGVDDSILLYANLMLLCRDLKAVKEYSTIRRKLLKNPVYNYNGYIIWKVKEIKKTTKPKYGLSNKPK